MDFSTQNPTKKRYYTCSQLYLFKNDIFTHMTLKLPFWPWKWPWIIQLILEMRGRSRWYLCDIINSPIKDNVAIELIRKIYYITIWSFDFITQNCMIFHWFWMQYFLFNLGRPWKLKLHFNYLLWGIQSSDILQCTLWYLTQYYLTYILSIGQYILKFPPV